jgi:hypothetical protein
MQGDLFPSPLLCLDVEPSPIMGARGIAHEASGRVVELVWAPDAESAAMRLEGLLWGL